MEVELIEDVCAASDLTMDLVTARLMWSLKAEVRGLSMVADICVQITSVRQLEGSLAARGLQPAASPEPPTAGCRGWGAVTRAGWSTSGAAVVWWVVASWVFS